MGLSTNKVLGIDGVDEIVDVLDETGQKQVFITKAKGEKCVIKIMHIAQGGVIFQGKLNRAEREINLINEINSDYTPKLGLIKQQVVKDGSDYYLLYSEQYIPGKDVSQLIEEGFYLVDTEMRIRKLIHDVVEAIKTYWFDANETVHRDIKPQNIRLNECTGNYVLIDAGIAYIRNKTNFTSTGFRSPGTPGFLSPEHMLPGKDFSYRTDLYCLGVVAYIAATGEHPTDDISLDNEGNDKRVVTHKPTSLSDLRDDMSWELNSVIMKMLTKQAHQRPRKLESIIKAMGEGVASL